MQISTCLQIALKSGQILTWLDHRPEHNASGLHCTSSLLMQMEANSLLIYVIIQPGLNQAQISTKIAGLLFSHGGLRPPNNSYDPTATDSAALTVSRHPLLSNRGESHRRSISHHPSALPSRIPVFSSTSVTSLTGIIASLSLTSCGTSSRSSSFSLGMNTV